MPQPLGTRELPGVSAGNRTCVLCKNKPLSHHFSRPGVWGLQFSFLQSSCFQQTKPNVHPKVGLVSCGASCLPAHLLAHRAFSDEAFRRTWSTLATGIRTALLTRSLGIDASTAACRSALKWACPKSVSGISVYLSLYRFARLLRSNHQER